VVSSRAPDLRAPGDALSSGRRTYVIFNPAAGRGRGARRIATYRQLLEGRLPHLTFGTTSRPGEERELAERAIDDGYEVIVAVGGDGTWSNVADRVMASGKGDLVFGILPNGTGNDFGRNLGLDFSDPRRAVDVLLAGHTSGVDVGFLETPSASEHDPERVEQRYFLNLVGFGFDIAVIDAAARARFLKGEILYKVTALKQLFRFPGIRFTLASPDGPTRDGRHLILTVSNGAFFGGGFPIAPGATLTDGLLHACRIQDAPPMRRLHLFNRAEKGLHVSLPEVELLGAAEFRLTFPDPPRFEMDGDVRQSRDRELVVRSLPRGLNLLTPPPGGGAASR